MSLVVAKYANKMGMPKTAERIAKKLYGEPFGKISKSGYKAYSCIYSENGARLITVLDSKYNLYSQTMRSESGNITTRLIYDNQGNVVKGSECVKHNNKVVHKIVKPTPEQVFWGEWIYNKQTGDKQVIVNDVPLDVYVQNVKNF